MAKYRGRGGTTADHADFMIDTLAPDLRRDGRVHTAQDVAACGRLMRAGQKKPAYARWLKDTLIPDLRASGMVETAKDLARCARAIGRRR